MQAPADHVGAADLKFLLNEFDASDIQTPHTHQKDCDTPACIDLCQLPRRYSSFLCRQ